jgi:hypothetical protein
MSTDLLKWNPNTQITKSNYLKAAELAQKLKSAQKLIEEELGPAIKLAHQAHKAVKAVMDKQLNQYKSVEGVLKDKFAGFHVKNKQLKVDGLAFVDTLEPVIVDESKIPDDYKIKVPDIKRIKAEIKMNGTLFKVPGIKLKSNTEVRIYARKD